MSGGMLPWEILKLRSSEIARKVHFLFIFVSSKYSRRQSSYIKRDTLPETLKSGGGYVLPVRPVPTFMLVNKVYIEYELAFFQEGYRNTA